MEVSATCPQCLCPLPEFSVCASALSGCVSTLSGCAPSTAAVTALSGCAPALSSCAHPQWLWPHPQQLCPPSVDVASPSVAVHNHLPSPRLATPALGARKPRGPACSSGASHSPDSPAKPFLSSPPHPVLTARLACPLQRPCPLLLHASCDLEFHSLLDTWLLQLSHGAL